MNEDYDYSIPQEDVTVLKNLSEMGERLKELKKDMEAKKEEAKKAEDAYTHYATSVLPLAMRSANVSELKLMTGGKITYDSKYYCQPNKNEDDQKAIADWLRANGGEHLIKERLSVPSSDRNRLKELGVPFAEMANVNTLSLKAFLKSQVESKRLSIDDIPKAAHFSEISVVDIGA